MHATSQSRAGISNTFFRGFFGLWLFPITLCHSLKNFIDRFIIIVIILIIITVATVVRVIHSWVATKHSLIKQMRCKKTLLLKVWWQSVKDGLRKIRESSTHANYIVYNHIGNSFWSSLRQIFGFHENPRSPLLR